ncbi:winged helix-turn-helix transcriptional regulator [Metaclostridioides mangenotii]|uniref:winged helix-turn-helix transcriptional regulator n=1 Tax=Metaclostridioides mangenotii TaxID=1540 RepID=UPI0004B040C2|nr:helix-turn-helix domain-containing protein [Clostridioides mangenotii]
MIMSLGNEKMILNSEELICPIKYALDIVGGKWKLPILCILASGKPTRYSSLKRKLEDITNTMLAQSLKELESDEIILRKQYNEVPPKVEYTITEKGNSIIPILGKFAKWGSINMKEEKACGDKCKKCQDIK